MEQLGLFWLLIVSPLIGVSATRGEVRALVNCTKEQVLDYPNLARISELNVEFCNISTLENAFFIRFTGLTMLEITDSRLSSLEDFALHGLRQLKTLTLARNNISVVKSWSNEQMNALISLDLRRNAIKELTLKSFYRYPNLQRLFLAINLLEHIDEGVFRWMPHLKHLNLGRNRLKQIEARYFHGMSRLTHLSLHFNDIEFIAPTAFQSNFHLRSLKLEGNQLMNLEFMKAKNLFRLVHLNLSNNALKTLENLFFTPDYELTELDLSHNDLTELHVETFANLQSLEHLNVSHNSIHIIESRCLHELSSLEHIDLSVNNLTLLPVALFNGTNLLQYIDLSMNALRDIDLELFSHMPYLTVLNLSGNQLHAAAFIEYLAPELKRAELTLDLSDNLFSMLNMSVLMDFERVELAGNSWSCQWLIGEMLRTPQTIHFGRHRSVVTAWSNALLDVTGIDCYDEMRQRSIVVLDISNAWSQAQAYSNQTCKTNTNALPSAVPWPKMSTDKYDSRWVIIWMLIGIAIAFSALRVARKLLDRKERKKMAQRIKQTSNPNQQLKLNPSDHKLLNEKITEKVLDKKERS